MIFQDNSSRGNQMLNWCETLSLIPTWNVLLEFCRADMNNEL